MAKKAEAKEQKVTFKFEPFYSPEATDYYANMTAVGSTVFDVVLAFAQVFPDQVQPGQRTAKIVPKVRVTLSVEAAEMLLNSLARHLEMRKKAAAQPGAGDASSSS